MREDSFQYTLLKPLRDRAGAGYRGLSDRLSIFATLLDRELSTGLSVDIPFERRLWLWRRGFTSRSSALYDLDEGNYRQFVSDLQHERANDIAEPWDTVVSNKLTFYLLFSSYAEHLPDCYGVVGDGELRRSSPTMPTAPWAAPSDGLNGVERHDAVRWVDRYLDRRAALVLKPVYGHGGRGVFVCRKRGEDEYAVNGESKTRAAFGRFLDELEEYLAWEFAQQADYAERLYPDSVNTLRVLTMWDYEADEPFVSAAVHRIGTADSAPVDNWSNGGLSAMVTDDDELSAGAQWLPSEGEVRWFDEHPDTGDRIEGTRIPDWSVVRDGLLEMAAEYPSLPRLGWDVVLTGEGEFVVLEVNAHTGLRTLQVHKPLLEDPRVREFYEHHDCL
ncbi:hypothetical protein C474_13061 [Halogeometricum pallidum JCM 14848]|uniref:Alpha-L-glutamate ligase-related protein ATP-grasp domain-containing protein n=1 Tax=Halogeometricum pallidum JCM 14848 TaxID=1227487 RepID=M0D3E9_HALPD|nr:sugar-transfer associated ATP-grasp domain-containing protein [Halogeometricum pallidum]ELZ29965.1 hypothetical protein C474_13061 [Halogeometricum pallidum JCM 14848]